MKRNLFIISLFAIVTAVTASSVGAQILSRGDFFGPGAPPARAGIELGLGLQTQSGVFNAECNCAFSDGKGSGFLGDLFFELPVSYDWALSLKAGLFFMHNAGDLPVTDDAVVRYEPGDSVSNVQLQLNRHVDVNATYLMIMPGVRYQFFRGGPFVAVHAGIGFLLSSHFTQIRELTSSTVTLTDGTELKDVRFENGTREETLQDGELQGAVSTRFSAIFGGGYDIPVSDRALLTPIVQFELPFTKISDDPLAVNWKISQIMLMVGLKYILE